MDWPSLTVGRKFTVFALFYFAFEGNFPSTSPRGAYIWWGDLTEGFLRYRFWGLIFGGAYTWRGLFSKFYGDSSVFIIIIIWGYWNINNQTTQNVMNKNYFARKNLYRPSWRLTKLNWFFHPVLWQVWVYMAWTCNCHHPWKRRNSTQVTTQCSQFSQKESETRTNQTLLFPTAY